MSADVCKECGRPVSPSWEKWLYSSSGELCGSNTGSTTAREECHQATIERLKVRVAELEAMIGPRLHIWELSGDQIWVVAETEEECWGHLEDQHGDADEVTERKEDGQGWKRLPADKKISLMVDEDGDVCGADDGAPCSMPAWVWAVRHGAGFLGETE